MVYNERFINVFNGIKDEVNELIISGKSCDCSLATGLSGVCILFLELEKLYPDDKWEYEADKIVQYIMNNIQKNGIYDISLYSGITGVALALSASKMSRKRYANYIDSLNDFIVYKLNMNLDYIDLAEISPINYDVIAGVSGILNYLLFYKENPSVIRVIERGLKFLTQCFEKKKYKSEIVPNVYVERKNLLSENEMKIFSDGCLNTSLSHGVSGIACVLSLSLLEGIEVDNQKDTILEILSILDKSYTIKNKKIIWKGCIDYKEYSQKTINYKNLFVRDAWCYGTPGISLVYLYSGLALNINEYKKRSVNTFLNACNNIQGIYSPILCHGYAGILEIGKTLYTFADCSKKSEIQNYLNKFYDKVNSYYSNNNMYGFKDYEYESEKIKELEKIGFLDGSIGIHLSLMTNIKSNDAFWRKALLLK